MNSRKDAIYDPSGDQQLLSVGGSADATGKLLDIHETLFLSDSAGFYLHRQIRQVRRGRTWETAELGECDDYPVSGDVRFLKLIRPMSRAQVIRFVVDAYMPREGGLHLATHLALNNAGIPEC
jgi:hypothetical protein